jgi:predicted GIY-YIG superfamily endonuclease
MAESLDDGIVCYCLEQEGSRRTYVGYTVNLRRRLRQHNKDLVGGAKYTRQGVWHLRWVVTGFETKNIAMSFEWNWKFRTRRCRLRRLTPIEKRRHAAVCLLRQDERFSTCALHEVNESEA